MESEWNIPNLTVCSVLLTCGARLITIPVNSGRRSAHVLIGDRSAMLIASKASRSRAWLCPSISANAVGGGVRCPLISTSVIGGACALANMTSEGLWLALEEVTPLLATAKRSSLLLEVVHANSWKGGSTVVMCLVVVDLVDWNRRVDDMRLNGLLVDDRLDRLVHMVVDMLSLDTLILAIGLLAIYTGLTVLIFGAFVFEATLEPVGIAVFERTMLNLSSLVMVLLRQHLRVVHGLL